MFIDLEPVFKTDGYSETFSYDLDLKDEFVSGIQPFRQPVNISGRVYNSVGIVHLDARAKFTLDAVCDRCAEEFSEDFDLELSHVLVRFLNDDENDEFILADESQLNLDEIYREDIFLALPFKFLCSDDCKGLCPQCGKNLNDGPCDCKKPGDPRFEILQQLITDD